MGMEIITLEYMRDSLLRHDIIEDIEGYNNVRGPELVSFGIPSNGNPYIEDYFFIARELAKTAEYIFRNPIFGD